MKVVSNQTCSSKSVYALGARSSWVAPVGSALSPALLNIHRAISDGRAKVQDNLSCRFLEVMTMAYEELSEYCVNQCRYLAIRKPKFDTLVIRYLLLSFLWRFLSFLLVVFMYAANWPSILTASTLSPKYQREIATWWCFGAGLPRNAVGVTWRAPSRNAPCAWLTRRARDRRSAISDGFKISDPLVVGEDIRKNYHRLWSAYVLYCFVCAS